MRTWMENRGGDPISWYCVAGFYEWEGKLEEDAEKLLMIKTQSGEMDMESTGVLCELWIVVEVHVFVR